MPSRCKEVAELNITERDRKSRKANLTRQRRGMTTPRNKGERNKKKANITRKKKKGGGGRKGTPKAGHNGKKQV